MVKLNPCVFVKYLLLQQDLFFRFLLLKVHYYGVPWLSGSRGGHSPLVVLWWWSQSSVAAQQFQIELARGSQLWLQKCDHKSHHVIFFLTFSDAINADSIWLWPLSLSLVFVWTPISAPIGGANPQGRGCAPPGGHTLFSFLDLHHCVFQVPPISPRARLISSRRSVSSLFTSSLSIGWNECSSIFMSEHITLISAWILASRLASAGSSPAGLGELALALLSLSAATFSYFPDLVFT